MDDLAARGHDLTYLQDCWSWSEVRMPNGVDETVRRDFLRLYLN